jgi:hypothetical protein
MAGCGRRPQILKDLRSPATRILHDHGIPLRNAEAPPARGPTLSDGTGCGHSFYMDLDAAAWIERLPAELGGQKAILRRLLAACAADDDIRWLLIGCSLARGAADRLSDLDLGMGVRDEEFPAAAARVRRLVDGLGELVESYQHQIPGVALRHVRIFAQYADRCQVDLVVFLDSMTDAPSAVVLYDPDRRLTIPAGRPPVTPEQVREWAFHGWCALADLGKYLRRRSAWEALGRLGEARDRLWQLCAVAGGVPDPQYGLTSILDFAPGLAGPEMAATVSGLDLDRLLAAGRRLAGLFNQVGERLPDDQRAALPAAMARFVTADLAATAV